MATLRTSENTTQQVLSKICDVLGAQEARDDGWVLENQAEEAVPADGNEENESG